MPDKPWDKLWEIDQRLRRLFPTQMWDNFETICTIEMYGGFEFFNNRPYHNYENWSSGFKITTGKRYGEITVSAEDLDDAVSKLECKLGKWREEQETQVKTSG